MQINTHGGGEKWKKKDNPAGREKQAARIEKQAAQIEKQEGQIEKQEAQTERQSQIRSTEKVQDMCQIQRRQAKKSGWKK